MFLCYFVLSVIRSGEKKQNSSKNMILTVYLVHSVALLGTCILDAIQPSAVWQYICCIVYTLSGYLALFCYGKYYMETCEADAKSLKNIRRFNILILIFNLAGTMPLIPSGLFFSVTPEGVYIRGPLFFLSYLFVAMELLTLALYSVFFLPNRKKAVGYAVFGFLPLLFSVLITLLPIASPMIDFSAAISYIILYSFVSLEDREKALENEAKLSECRADLLLSQANPRFIAATLSTISSLCVTEPQKAKELTEDFAEYLRKNTGMISAGRLSAFETELAHARKYLDIEGFRLGERLKVEYDIQESGFEMPSLSLQPIVENAVQYGIVPKQNGGTVRITARRTRFCCIVTVSDDGPGFDVEHFVPKEGQYGISNTAERLKILTNGELRIESGDFGTTVTILVNGTEEKPSCAE